jgi:hypothetical protein
MGQNFPPVMWGWRVRRKQDNAAMIDAAVDVWGSVDILVKNTWLAASSARPS